MKPLLSFITCLLLTDRYNATGGGTLSNFLYDYKTQYIMSVVLFWIIVVLLIVLLIVIISKKNRIIGIKIKELAEINKVLELKNKEVAELLSKKMERDKIINEIVGEMKNIELKDKISKEIMSRIVKSLKDTVSDDVLTDFDKYFLYIHPDFYNNLHKMYPELTQNELRLCAMVRLNMSTKDIAEINNIEPNSARIAKIRLRKTLGISNTEESLFTFLSEF